MLSTKPNAYAVSIYQALGLAEVVFFSDAGRVVGSMTMPLIDVPDAVYIDVVNHRDIISNAREFTPTVLCGAAWEEAKKQGISQDAASGVIKHYWYN